MQETNIIDKIKERYTQYNLSRVESLDMLRPSDIRRLCFDVGASLLILAFLEILIKNAALYMLSFIVYHVFSEISPVIATTISHIFSSFVSYAPKLLVFWFLYRKYRKLNHLLPTYKNNFMYPVVMLFATFSFGMCGSYITKVINYALQILFGAGEIPNVMEQTAPLDSSSGLVMLIFSALIAPICEELIYRKFLLGSLRPMGETPAILLSSLIFGLAHGNFDQFAYAMLSGIVFAILAVRYRSIIPTIVLHILNNLLVSVVVYRDILLTGNNVIDSIIDAVCFVGNSVTNIAYVAMPFIVLTVALCGVAKVQPVTGEDKKEKLCTVFCPILILGLFTMLMKFI
ncbi:MAG: CPBP family intramembrane metalloprotease [Ruminococcaceae bacterium]|nr:CPBP family intramembrane metalloprotease [Oscillospiraceae bacterium]